MRADATKVTRLMKTARGQMDGIMRMIEKDQYCLDISQQILACSAILRKANMEIIKCHIEGCVAEAFQADSQALANEKIQELVELLDKMVK